MPEGEDQQPFDPENEREPSGMDELLYAIGEAVRHKATKDAIASLIQKYADELPNRSKNIKRAITLGHFVTVFMVFAVGVLGYMKVISGETTGVILAAIAGYVYGHRR